MAERPDLRIFLIDPHNEYGRCFGDKALVLTPRNLRLPFWLFNFEETIDAFFGGLKSFQGTFATALRPDELLTEIRLPLFDASWRAGFYEFSRRAGDFAISIALAATTSSACDRRSSAARASQAASRGRTNTGGAGKKVEG